MDKFALINAIYNIDATYQKFSKEYAGYTKFKISEEVSLPCYGLFSSEELDCLFEFVIKYYGEEENE